MHDEKSFITLDTQFAITIFRIYLSQIHYFVRLRIQSRRPRNSLEEVFTSVSRILMKLSELFAGTETNRPQFCPMDPY